MKAGWVAKTVGDCCEVISGQSPEGKFYNSEGKGLPFYQGKKEFGEKFIQPASTWTEQTTKVAQQGDILMSVRAPVGPINFANETICIGRGLAAIRCSEQLDREYLFYQLQHLQPEIAGREGAVFASINKSEISELPIAVAPISEQKRIVALLDQAFAEIATAKANAEKNLQNARALFESYLNKVFAEGGEGWVECPLEELGTITSSKRIFKSEYVKSGIPFYRTKEIKELANDRSITTELFISEGRYKEIKNSFGVPVAGDILLTAIGTIGEIWVVDGDSDFYFKDGNVLWLKGFNSINPHFLRYVLLSFVENLNRMAHGSAYSALPIHRLNSHRIFLPAPAEQQAIVNTLDTFRDETQRLQSIYQQKMAALDELKQSLLHQAFSGAL